MVDRQELLTEISRLRQRESRRFRDDLNHREAALTIENRISEDDGRLARSLLRSAGADLDRIEEHERKQSQERLEMLKEIRQKVRRSPETLTDHRLRTALALELGGATPGRHLLPPYAGSMRASNDQILDAIPGTREDDGTVSPEDPSLIDLSLSHAHTDWNWFGDPVHEKPVVEADVYYGFIPTKTGTHQIRPSVDLHGFYIVTANDSWWNSRSAEVRLTVTVGAGQYGIWRAYESWRVIKERKTNGTEYGRLDETKTFKILPELAEGDGVVVLLRFTLRVIVDGQGSSGEIDFGSGSGNYIRPLPMTIEHL